MLPSSALPDVERRSIDVHDHFRSGCSLEARRPVRHPDVLADVYRYGDAAHRYQRDRTTGMKIPVLVEDPVIRQKPLAVSRDDATFGHDRRGIRQFMLAGGDPAGERRFGMAVSPLPDVADHRDDVLAVFGDVVECTMVILDEAGFQQQVLGRISGHGEFRKRDDVSFGFASLLDPGLNRSHIARDVPDGRVDLGHRNSEGPHRRSSPGLLQKKSSGRSHQKWEAGGHRYPTSFDS